MSQTVRPTRPPSTTERTSHRGARAAKAAAERRIALVAVCVIALACVFGAVIHSQTGSAHAASANAAVAGQTLASSQTCPYNGCTSPTCHGKATAGSKRSSVASGQSGKRTSVQAASTRSKSTASTAAQASSGLSSAQVAAKARLTASATAARSSAAMAASARTKATPVAAAKPAAKKSSTPTPASTKPKPAKVITIETFGYSFAGPPSGCKFVADVRNINAGTFTQSENGLMASVRKRVMATAAAKAWHNVMLKKWLPKLKAGDKVAIGCARGHHRSVSLAVVFAADLRAHGLTVKLVNRDIHNTW